MDFRDLKESLSRCENLDSAIERIKELASKLKTDFRNSYFVCQVYDTLYLFFRSYDFEEVLDMVLEIVYLNLDYDEICYSFMASFLKRLSKMPYLTMESERSNRWFNWLTDPSNFFRKQSDHHLWHIYLRILSRSLHEKEIILTILVESMSLIQGICSFEKNCPDWNLFVESLETYFLEEHVKSHILLLVKAKLKFSVDIPGLFGGFGSIFQIVQVFSSHDGDLVEILYNMQKLPVSHEPNFDPLCCFKAFLGCVGEDAVVIMEFLMDNVLFLSYFTDFVKYLDVKVKTANFKDDEIPFDLLHDVLVKLESYREKNMFPYNPEYLIKILRSVTTCSSLAVE